MTKDIKINNGTQSEKKDPILDVSFINSEQNIKQDNTILPSLKEKETNEAFDKRFYRGAMLVTTVTKESGFEKHVYIKNSFVKDGMVHIDTEGAELAIKYDLEKIDKFIKSGILSTDDGERLKEDIFGLERQMKAWREWKVRNPDISGEQESKAFQEITGSANFDEVKAKKTNELNLSIRKLIAQKDSIEPEVIESLPELFKNINPEDCFAITKPIMGRMYHLPELLKNAEAINISGGQWEIKSKLDNRGTGPIGLFHTFRAVDAEDAKKYLDEYRDWIRGEGLKVLNSVLEKSLRTKMVPFFHPIV